MRREYPATPIAGVVAVIFSGNKILLVRRGIEPSKDLWELPGGVVELAERGEDAIVREVEEETGILVKPLTPHARDEQMDQRVHHESCV